MRGRPQENFARELMELFTMGVGTFTETDVYAGARVFTGWNLSAAEQCVLRLRLQRGLARRRREGVLVPDLYERQPGHSRARGRCRACRTAWI